MDSMQNVPRLIEKFIPKNYKLSINLDRIQRKFSGIVTIYGASQPKSKTIDLHSKNLTIESVVVDGKSAKFSNVDDNTLSIVNQDLTLGDHIIVISYSGEINDSMHGLYPCYYDNNGVKKELLATQFESHHAREVFPCIDEPAAKATFDVTLTTETDVTVIGNMPILNQKIENDNLVTTFETTPIMSSYLLAWVVGELHKKSAKTKDGVEVNVWATPAQPADSLDFALDIAVRSIEFFDEYFGVAYPLSKSDHVALPDFSSGAMENWGLITYREIALLASPATTSITSKRYIATVIAHELSHQWFGNLVTMEWWNDLWLNESFASLVEYTAIDALEPTWNVWLDFASGEVIYALKRDSLDGVQPVQIDVHHPDEIGTLFDGAIVYAKGAHLLQMLQQYIGDIAFRDGLMKYFKTYAYKNTQDKDLWRTLEGASGKNIENFMNSWITQPGFPVLHVSRLGNEISLLQERLADLATKKSDTLWPIPLFSNSSETPEIMDSKSLTFKVSDDNPVRFNIDSKAHFITHYDQPVLQQIIKQLESGQLSTIDRLQLINEQTILANAGIITSAELIPLLSAYKNETAEAVWDVISITIGELKKFVDSNKSAEIKFQKFIRELASVQYKRLGWDQKTDEPATDTKLRCIILGLMIYSEDRNVIDTAIELFHSTTVDKINPEMRGLIISAVVRHTDDNKIIDYLLETYKTTASAELKQDINVGITSTRKADTIDRLLNIIKDTSVVRTQDTFRWVAYLMRNKYAREQTWLWLRNNWDWIKETFGNDKSYDDYPRYSANSLSTRQQFQEYCDFFKPLISDPALTRVINIGINEIENRVDLIERDGTAVRETLLNF
jgi:aminopeptidase N